MSESVTPLLACGHTFKTLDPMTGLGYCHRWGCGPQEVVGRIVSA